MWSGFSSEIETAGKDEMAPAVCSRMWSGFSSEIETSLFGTDPLLAAMSHVERLLI